MLIFRLVFGLLLLAGVLCFAMYIATGHPTWKRNGFIIVKWTVLAALAFFMVLILERLAVLLLERLRLVRIPSLPLPRRLTLGPRLTIWCSHSCSLGAGGRSKDIS